MRDARYNRVSAPESLLQERLRGGVRRNASTSSEDTPPEVLKQRAGVAQPDSRPKHAPQAPHATPLLSVVEWQFATFMFRIGTGFTAPPVSHTGILLPRLTVSMDDMRL